MQRVYIVTGSNGFLGNNVIRKLIKNKENEVRALVLPNDKVDSLEGIDCKRYVGDVTKKESLSDIFDVPKDTELYVIHCAAVVYIKSKYNKLVHDVNVNGTKNIVEKVLEHNAKMVYVSSVHAITEKDKGEIITEIEDFDPSKVEGAYAKTKAETAKYVLEVVKKRKLNACIVHPSGIIGPNDYGSSHLTQLIIDVVRGRLKACVNGGYDFVDVRDVADGVISACTKGKSGECYILSNRYIEVKELLDLISEVSNKRRIKLVLPMWIAKITAPLSEMYYTMLNQPPLYTKYSLYTLNSNSNFSNKKAKNELNYNNREIRETIVDTIEWLKENNRIN